MRLTEAESRPADAADACPAAPLVVKLGRWASQQFGAALRPVGLKPRHLGTLIELRHGPLPQQALGDAVGVDAAQLVGVLNDLEAEGLVERRRDPNDRRRHFVELSTAGCERLAVADRAMAEIDGRLLAGLAPAERAHFVSLLRFVVDHGAFDADEGAGECDGST